MKIAVIGSGDVGQAMAKGLVQENHEVWLGTREPEGEKGQQLANDIDGITISTFEKAAQEAELAIFAVNWPHAQEVVELIGPQNLAGKTVVDTSNVIKPSDNIMLYGDADPSAGELVQQWLPDAHVVKAYNTVGAGLMYQPSFESKPTMFVAGDDADAKQQVIDTLVTPFGWEALDVGGLVMSRMLEPMALLWINNAIASGQPHAFKML